MPYKSDKQRRYFHWAKERGEIDPKVVEEFDKEERKKKFKNLKKYLKKD